eukprot:CAMPEP_0117018714 /NCGR_PEP_ID=MMETSP0472-20121206/14437_1 /TAXON_ID=693140 ORGANISM="Tiarina fusus, Strain LIS" /NCGR_SAMPLE_ID=MMETSP0472 /ASSEMBLY_ACC=CAM_ASM_000603 /LENGTH=356 /DNA_ID=CAMNT_0004723445 /DNA_START=59 /DNA_END=1129 /DNA_ORIENTATION=+
MPSTFVVSENTELSPLNASTDYEAQVARLPPLRTSFSGNSKTKLLKATKPDIENLPYQPMSNGFVSAAFLAYSSHHHLIISPDDVWIAITTAFSQYVNNHAEEMRNIFVSHEGQKELVVKDVGTIHSVNWDSLIGQLAQKIEENTNTDIKNWIVPDFSTTTTITRTVGSVVLMAAMQKYFSYKVCLCCGLPMVTMLGTLEDWKTIRTKADALLSYKHDELNRWHGVLTSVLDEFVASFEGKVNRAFWNRIANREGGGSGPRYLTGWILAFLPWNDGNTYILNSIEHIRETNEFGRVNTNDIAPSAVSVPVTIDDNGVEYKTTFYAGHLAAVPGPDEHSVKPYLGWCMVQNKDEDEA